LQTIEFDDVIMQLKNNNLNYTQFYNVDIDVPEYYSIQHYKKNNHDTINTDQNISTIFIDIEVFSNHTGQFLPSNAISPISAITIYNSKNKTYYAYLLILPQISHLISNDINISELINKFKIDLVEHKYIPENEQIEIEFYTDELLLIENCWSKIHEIDPVTISGYYSDGYDIPYIYNRLFILYENDAQKVANTMSKLRIIKLRKFGNKVIINIPEYPILDIKHLYCPRDEGGLNYGKKQPSYSLDYISNVELNLKKLDYKGSGNSNLDTFYLNDPLNYFKYNIIDVILTVRLNDKLKHIDFHNTLRRDMKCSLSNSIRGVSALFSAMFSYEIQELSQYMRYGVHAELENSINQIDIEQIDPPKTKSIKKWTVTNIDNKTFRSVMSKFPGAYISNGYNDIITMEDDVIIVDSDATALYPSCMSMCNISFDSLFGYVLQSNTYKFLKYLITITNTNATFSQSIKNNIFSKIEKKVDYISPQNKTNYKQYMFYMFYYLVNQLLNSKTSMKNIMAPNTLNEYIILKTVLLPLLHLFTEIQTLEDHHIDAYRYIVNNEDIEHDLYIVENVNQMNIRIVNIPKNSLAHYLDQENISFNLSGALFYTHEKYTGILNKFITNKLEFRKQYKTKRDTYSVGSPEYNFYDSRQKSSKVNVNSSYGLSGLSSFIYSNRLCAASTTLTGRLVLKLSQVAGEEYINNNF